MVDGATPQSSYERKIKLMLDVALRRFRGLYTEEQYATELRAAKGVLSQLGVRP